MSKRCNHLEDYVAAHRAGLPLWARVQWPTATLKNMLALMVVWDIVGILAGLYGNIAERSMPKVTGAGVAYLAIGGILIAFLEHVSKASVRRREAVEFMEKLVRDGHVECVQCAFGYRGGAS